MCKEHLEGDTFESKARVRDETKNATEVGIAAGNRERTASKVDVGTHLSEQEVVTDALLKNEANAQEIERVKIGSNKICIREDPAKDKMVFSEESSRVIFEMGNVELIELKNLRLDVHHVCITCLRVHFSLWTKEAFEALEAPHCRTSSIATRGGRCGPKPWQPHHHNARDASRSATKSVRTFTSI